MFIFFTIPWFVIAVIILMVFGIGMSVIEFILRHIVIISVLIGLPILFLIRSAWKDENYSMEEKLEWTLFPILQVPTYAATIQMLRAFTKEAGLFEMILMLVGIPIEIGIIMLVGFGVAFALKWLYLKVIKSCAVTVCLGIVISVGMTWFLWNTRWML